MLHGDVTILTPSTFFMTCEQRPMGPKASLYTLCTAVEQSGTSDHALQVVRDSESSHLPATAMNLDSYTRLNPYWDDGKQVETQNEEGDHRFLIAYAVIAALIVACVWALGRI